jgi:DNA primase
MTTRIELDNLRLRLEEVISRYVALKRKGKVLVGLCPFHTEKTPSFSVTPGKFFKCFGCGAKGDVFAFVMRIAGVSFREAKEIIGGSSVARIASPTQTTSQRPATVGFGTVQNWELLAAFYERAAKLADHARLAELLGVTACSLQRLRAGLCGPATWAFPMQQHGTITGIRVRAEDGKKWAVTGTKDGLFVPWDLNGALALGAIPLVICEGPTDTAAMLDLGLSAVGRSNCQPFDDLLAPLARGRYVVIVADTDSVGQSGAANLRDALKSECKDIRIVTPVGAKDAREWKRKGLTREQFLEAAYAG